jgi:hypothetical protein
MKTPAIETVLALAESLDGMPLRRRLRLPPPRPERPSPSIGRLIRVCPGGRKAWYESSAGPVRKPLTQRAATSPATPAGGAA